MLARTRSAKASAHAAGTAATSLTVEQPANRVRPVRWRRTEGRRRCSSGENGLGGRVSWLRQNYESESIYWTVDWYDQSIAPLAWNPELNIFSQESNRK